MAKMNLSYLAYVFAIVGGIVMVLSSVVSLLGMAFVMPFGSPLSAFFAGSAIIPLILGLVAIYLSKRAGELVTAIVLIIIGLIGSGIGGLLVLLGGILGLLSRFVHV